MAGRVQPRQLALALPHAESLARDDFLEGPANEAALGLIDSWLTALPAEYFEQVLPLLRRTTAMFSAGERRQIAERHEEQQAEPSTELLSAKGTTTVDDSEEIPHRRSTYQQDKFAFLLSISQTTASSTSVPVPPLQAT